MKKFQYAKDPVCVVACLLYAANRWLLPLAWKGPFLQNHFNDCLLIPAALPLVLWVHRLIGLRTMDATPTRSEVVLHLAAWSVAAEALGPYLFTWTTGDLWDVVAYSAGAGIATALWSFG